MKLYQCPTNVRAARILEILPGKEPGGAVVRVDTTHAGWRDWDCAAMWMKTFRPLVGGYLIAHANGFISFSPVPLAALGFDEAEEPGSLRMWMEGDVLHADHPFGGPMIKRKLTAEQLQQYNEAAAATAPASK